MNTPVDPRNQRYRPLAGLLTIGIALVGTLAVITVVLGESAGRGVGIAMVLALVSIPLLRVAWLVGRWIRRGDPLFAVVGIAVIMIPLAGFLLAR